MKFNKNIFGNSKPNRFLHFWGYNKKNAPLALTHLSGNWSNGTNAGLFNWNLNNGFSNRNRNIGTHLEYMKN